MKEGRTYLSMNLTLSNENLIRRNRSLVIIAYTHFTYYSLEDDQRNYEMKLRVCVIPARKFRPSGRLLVKVFSLRTWLTIIFGLSAVRLFVSFPSVRATAVLVASVISSILTPSDVKLPLNQGRFSNPRVVAFTIAFFMIHIVLSNIYKNELTSELSPRLTTESQDSTNRARSSP